MDHLVLHTIIPEVIINIPSWYVESGADSLSIVFFIFGHPSILLFFCAMFYPALIRVTVHVNFVTLGRNTWKLPVRWLFKPESPGTALYIILKNSLSENDIPIISVNLRRYFSIETEEV